MRLSSNLFSVYLDFLHSCQFCLSMSISLEGLPKGGTLSSSPLTPHASTVPGTKQMLRNCGTELTICCHFIILRFQWNPIAFSHQGRVKGWTLIGQLQPPFLLFPCFLCFRQRTHCFKHSFILLLLWFCSCACFCLESASSVLISSNLVSPYTVTADAPSLVSLSVSSEVKLFLDLNYFMLIRCLMCTNQWDCSNIL